MADRRVEHRLVIDSQILRDGGAKLCKPGSSFQAHSSGKREGGSAALVKLILEGCKIRNGEDACMPDHSLTFSRCSQKAEAQG